MIAVEIHALAVAILSLLPPALIGIFLVVWVMPSDLDTNFPTKASIGVVLGLGVDSCLYYIWSILFSPGNLDFFAFETAVLFTLGILCYRKLIKGKSTDWLQIRNSWPLVKTIPILVFGVLFISLAAIFLVQSYLNPYARFDAFAIWNLRARQIFGSGDAWRSSFSPLVYHADYPLMLPLTIVRGWVLIGVEVVQTQMLVAMAFTLSLPAIIFTVLSKMRGHWQAAIAGIILLGTPKLFIHGVNQVADVPLSAFILVAGILFYYYCNSGKKEYLSLSGLAAGLAAWTKNEGTVFLGILCITTIVWVFTHEKKWSHLLFYLLGITIPLFVLIHFKLFLAPPGDMIAGRSFVELLQPFTKIDRYAIVTQYFLQYLAFFDGWKIPVVFILITCALILPDNLKKNERLSIFFLWGIIVILLIAYFCIYIATPHDPVWHLTTSLDRLLLHIFPLFILSIFLFTRSAEKIFTSYRRRTQKDFDNLTRQL